MLNVNRLPNSIRLEIAAAIAEEVYRLELDDEALIHELRRYGFSQAYAEAMTYRHISPDNTAEVAPGTPKRQHQRKTSTPKITPTNHPCWVFVDDVLTRAEHIRPDRTDKSLKLTKNPN